MDYKTSYSSDKNINTMDRGSYNDFGDGTPAKQVLAKQPNGHEYLIQAKFGDLRFPISLGLTPGIEVVRVFGYNDDVDSSVKSDIIFQSGDYYFIPSPVTLDVVSDNVGDTIGGVGARTILIEGLDSNYNEISETINMNGVIPVITSNTYLRINNAYVLTAGVAQRNSGNITITASGNIVGVIVFEKEGTNKLQQAIYTVPAGKTALLTQVLGSIVRKASGSGTKEGEISLEIRKFGELFQSRGVVGARSDGTSTLTIDPNYPIAIPEKSDIKGRANSFTGNTRFNLDLFILLIDNEIYGL